MTAISRLRFNTRPLRRAAYAYASFHGLAKPGTYPEEHGITAESGKPLGKPFRAFLRRIQRHMHLAHPVKFPERFVDGTFNSKTRAIVKPPVVLTRGQRIVIRALKEVGVHEVGRNGGRRVHFYQSSTGAYDVAWCASFCSKMAQLEGYDGPVSAGAWHLTDHCGKRMSLITALPGCAVSLDVGDGHVGILERVNHSAGTVTLIAGNTSDSVKIRDYPMGSVHSICSFE